MNLLQDGKQNHVSFPEFQQNGSAKQFSHGRLQSNFSCLDACYKAVLSDYISEVMNEDDTEPKSSREEWDSPITFTAKSSRKSFFKSLHII